MTEPAKQLPRYTPEQIAIMHQILDLAILSPKGCADVFLSFSPHVNAMDVRVVKGEWSDRSPETFRFTAYFDELDTSYGIQLRDSLRNFLEKSRQESLVQP